MQACFVAHEQDFCYSVPWPATVKSGKEACCSEAKKRFNTDAQYDKLLVGKRRQYPDDTDPLHLDSKIFVTGGTPRVRKVRGCSSLLAVRQYCWTVTCINQSGSKGSVQLQGGVDPYQKAVKALAKKELLVCAATIRSRICNGKPNKPKPETQTFASKVDNNVQVFQAYANKTGVVLCSCLRYAAQTQLLQSVCTLCRAGVTLQQFKDDAQASFSARREVVYPTDEQLRNLVADCMEYVDLMQESMPHECDLVTNF